MRRNLVFLYRDYIPCSLRKLCMCVVIYTYETRENEARKCLLRVFNNCTLGNIFLKGQILHFFKIIYEILNWNPYDIKFTRSLCKLLFRLQLEPSLEVVTLSFCQLLFSRRQARNSVKQENYLLEYIPKNSRKKSIG